MKSLSAIDAHILLGDEPTEWRHDCLADISALPVQLYPCSAVIGNVSSARKIGWAQGAAPYITWFDPDDRYPTCASDFLSEAAHILDRRADVGVVYSHEQRVNDVLNPLGDADRKPYDFSSAITRPSGVHGLIVVRRALVEKYTERIADSDPTPEFRLIQAIALNGWNFVRLAYVARLWRQHAHNAHKIHNQINVIKSYSKALIEHP